MNIPITVGITARTLTLMVALGAGANAWGKTPADTLVVGKAAEPQNIDPAITESNNDWTISFPCYQRLVKYQVKNGKGSTDLEGELATSWKVSSDSLTWEFKLRGGQKFDDGTPVNAEAVKFTFERLMRIAQGPSQQWPSDLKVTVVDPGTVRFAMGQPCPYFASMLTNNCAGIINPKVLGLPDAGPDGKTYLSNHTAGSGPYRLTTWEKNQYLLLEPNPNFSGQKPILKRVIIKIVAEPSSRRLLLENGDLDIAEALPIDQLDEIAKKPDLAVMEYPSFLAHYLFLNNKRPPLDKVEVRQAISHAVDYNGIVNYILKGHGKQMRGPIPEGMWAHDPSAAQYTLNLQKAKDLLAKAHVSTLNLSFLYSSRDPNWEPIGLSLQTSLASIGINLKLEKVANATKSDMVEKGSYDIAIGRWSPDTSDPKEFINAWFPTRRQGPGGNYAFYSNAGVDDQLKQAITMVDQKKRTEIYRKVQKTVIEEAPYVYLFQANTLIAMNKAVKGFVYNPMLEQMFNFETISK